MATKSKPTPSQKSLSEAIAKDVDLSMGVMADKGESIDAPRRDEKSQATKRITKRKRGKKYLNTQARLESHTSFGVREAVELLKSIAYADFPETLELHVNTVVENIKGEAQLPFSTGKKMRVIAVDDTVIEQLEKGVVEFDLLVSTPQMMPKLTKYAKLLGPKGLMPNPKAGTVGTDVTAMLNKFSGNTVRYKTEPKSPIIHLVVGKIQDPADHLVSNLETYLLAIGKKNIKSAYLTTTMSPSVCLLIP